MNNPEDVEINMFASKEVKVFYEDGEYAVPDHYVCKLKDKKIEVDVVDFGAEWDWFFSPSNPQIHHFYLHDISIIHFNITPIKYSPIFECLWTSKHMEISNSS